MNETKNQVMVAWVAGILVGAIVALISGCNTCTRAVVGAGQGLVEDVGSAYRHARHQVEYADRTVRDEDARMQ